jgi:hypothetical protein
MKVLEIEEVLDLMHEKNMHVGFEITSESCYSGMACHKAKNWMEDNKDNCNFKYLVMTGSTYALNKGVWGAYRRFKTNSIVSEKDGGITKEKAKIA